MTIRRLVKIARIQEDPLRGSRRFFTRVSARGAISEERRCPVSQAVPDIFVAT